jgi:hypothetical protein
VPRVLSLVLMFGRFVRALRYAAREEEFLPILSAGAVLVAGATVTYSLVEDWHPVDAFYFAVATLTTTSVADPELVLEHRAWKLFTVFFLLIGIGILVEVLRCLGMGFVAVAATGPVGTASPRPIDTCATRGGSPRHQAAAGRIPSWRPTRNGG